MRRTAGRCLRVALPWSARRVAVALMALACLAPAIVVVTLAEAASTTPKETAPPVTWPRTLTRDGATITIYQPQAISWPDRKRLTARAAVAIQKKGQTKPMLGTVELSFATTTDTKAGIVHLADPELVSTHFPSLDTSEAKALQEKLRAALPTAVARRAVPLEAVETSLGRTPVGPVTVDNTPPVIFTATKPACLVVFDGDPVLAPVGKTGISAAVNTNWDVFETGGTWYLLADGIWLSAPKATGPYHAVSHLPAAFNHLPTTADYAKVRKAIPAHKPKSAASVPTVFVSTKPAEIIVTQGPPKFVPVSGTGLQRIENTASTLFFDPAKGDFYVLFSGRWFAASGLDGPWTFATDDLPADFAMIPPKDPAAAVLPSVPGTVEAEEAVLKAQIPPTATIGRGSAHPEVAYSGTPRFEPIAGTSIAYAANTGAVVLKIEGRYYVCQNGVWFVGNTPTGPWSLADSLPPAIQTIPPDSPYYNVTYVDVYGSTAGSVTYGYTAGYLMGFITAGVLVYGTGYYYPPVIWPGRYPIYYPRPYTYAGGIYYNPVNGAWARGGTIYGPYATARGGRYYNPTTGTWAAAGAVYGPNGGAGAWSVYNPRTGSYAHGSGTWGGGSGSVNANLYNARTGVTASTSRNWNPYGHWGSSTISGANKTVTTGRSGSAAGTTRGFTSSTGAAGASHYNKRTGTRSAVGKSQSGNVYAGRDGNVYRHTDAGWQTWNNGSWTPVQKQTGSRNTTTTGTTRRTQPGTTQQQRAYGTQGGRTPQYGTAQPRSTQPRSTQPRNGQPYERERATGTGMSHNNYQQLQRDYVARQAGDRHFGGGGGFARGGGRRR